MSFNSASWFGLRDCLLELQDGSLGEAAADASDGRVGDNNLRPM